MNVLGPGVRVFIGWCPPCNDQDSEARCRCGTIIEGPYPAGYRHLLAKSKCNYTSWIVCVDGLKDKYLVAEYLLSPIDDGTEAVVREQEAEVEA